MKSFIFWKRVISHPQFLPLFAVLIFSVLASRHLFTPGYFNMHDDLQLMRQLEMEKCFLDGQIPCRWVPDMGFGYGFPLFNFYPSLPYIVGQLIRILGFSFIDTAKLLFAIAFIASGYTMYFLVKELFDPLGKSLGKLSGVLAAVFYVWAPYHSVDIFVRGAMNEAWGLIWFPAILLFSYKMIVSSPKKELITGSSTLLALSWFGLLNSHNLMVMIFGPVFAVWCLFWILMRKNWRVIPQLAVAGILSFALSAFFTLPVFLEQKLVHANTLVQGYFEYTAHFATIGQLLFSRFWGYGPSVWMDADDKMPFQAGHVHWVLSLVVFVLALYSLIRKKKKPSLGLILAICYSIAIGWFAIFMAHSRSTPLWQAFEPLKFVQFPWRFLTIVIFGFSISAGAVLMFVPKKARLPLTILLSVFLVIFNWSYFRPEGGKNGPLTDQQKFTAAAWDLQRTAGIFDYLPLTAKENPRDGQNTVAEVVSGEAEVINPKQGTNWASFEVDAATASIVRINIYDFPTWKVFVNDNEVEHFIPESEKWGRMYINVEEGRHEVYVKLYDTPIRIIGNIISLLSWIVLIAYLIKTRKKLFA